MDFLMTAGIMLLLVLLGIPVFSAGAGFVLYPALSARVFRSLSLRMSAGMPDPEEALRRFRLWQSSCVRKEIAIRVRAGRGLLSGTLFVPKAGFPEGPDTGSPSVEKTPLRRIFIFTPEGRAFSPADFAPFLRAGFPERMAGILPDSAAPSAVFVPAPAEMFIPGRRFSFGKKESAALRLWTAFFRLPALPAEICPCRKKSAPGRKKTGRGFCFRFNLAFSGRTACAEKPETDGGTVRPGKFFVLKNSPARYKLDWQRLFLCPAAEKEGGCR